MSILTGRIDEATAFLNKHFPSVLSDTIEDVDASSSSDKLEYLPSTSVNPAHLALNLRIQAFVEAARTIPVLYYPPGSKTPLSHPPLLSAAAKHVSPDGDDDEEMSGPEDSEEANTQLLLRAQSLYSEANQLPRPEDRARYLHELGQVGGLLAYPVPERSPLAAYMTQQRREGVADQIDGAILCKCPVIAFCHLSHTCRLPIVLTNARRSSAAAANIPHRALHAIYGYSLGHAARKGGQSTIAWHMASMRVSATNDEPFPRV